MPTSSSQASAAGQRAASGLHEPKPPFREQHLTGTGAENELVPRPRYHASAYRAAGKLEGKVALITGGDSGIGRSVAVLYAKEGADVAIAYYSHDADAEETRRAVEAIGRRCLTLRGDVADPAFCRQIAQATVEQLGRLDILVSNASVQTRTESIADLSREQLERTFQVNVFGYFNMVQACLPHLGPGSAIIATGSETGLFGSPKLPDYSATKGAIHALTRSLAQQLLPKGIRVNAIAPGPVWTPLNPADQGLPPDQVAEFGAQTELKRPAQPEEIAPAYVFFASNADSNFVTGQVLAQLGGVTP
ncbi:MAG TPA: SDR family oxidoreductase [Polyangiaceae bacterium]|jgi:NAD(P)-dependent dehydrogenase (short-subunit alcohol dehydrogenase family)|nr:SDR family oxidoreductase [Polyangiaceae bacterium]